MGLLTEAEIRRAEKKHADGISSAAVVELFRKKGERFSEATLRKYVQLELLPKSRRVGTRGRHRGSSGLYPVGIVRLINEIKRELDAGAMLDEIRVGRVGLLGELSTLERTRDEVFDRFKEAVQAVPDKTRRAALRKTLDKHRRQLDREVKELDKLAMKIGRADRRS